MVKILIGSIRDGINFLIGDVTEVDAHFEPAIEQYSEFFLVRNLMLELSADLVVPRPFLFLLFHYLVGRLRMIGHVRVSKRFRCLLNYGLALLLFLHLLLSFGLNR